MTATDPYPTSRSLAVNFATQVLIVRYLSKTDFAAFARAAGSDGITVRNEGDLTPVRDWLERREGPLVIDAKVNPEIRAEWLADAFRSH